jgi:deoxyribonuclease-4
MESGSQEEKSSGRLSSPSLLLGSHLSLKSPDFYLGTCETALRYGETAFMFYTGAPQSARRAPLETLKIEEGRAFLKEHHFDEKAIIVHAPYILNLGNDSHPDSYEAGIALLRQEIVRTAAFGSSYLDFHPGNATGLPLEESLAAVAHGIDKAYEGLDTAVILCLETMAGKGSEVGRNFDELARIIGQCDQKDHLGVCLDTCHVNDEGVDVSHVDSVLDDFDHAIGLSRLKVIHLNDSKNPRGSHKDRHENIGYGTIGFSTLSAWAHNERLLSVPKILETPTDGIHDPYAQEIQMLRDNRYIENWREKLISDRSL